MTDKPIREQSALELLETHAKALEQENARLRAALVAIRDSGNWMHPMGAALVRIALEAVGPAGSAVETTCDHDYVWREAFRYECDKCGEISRDGVAEETSE